MLLTISTLNDIINDRTVTPLRRLRVFACLKDYGYAIVSREEAIEVLRFTKAFSNYEIDQSLAWLIEHRWMGSHNGILFLRGIDFQIQINGVTKRQRIERTDAFAWRTQKGWRDHLFGLSERTGVSEKARNDCQRRNEMTYGTWGAIPPCRHAHVATTDYSLTAAQHQHPGKSRAFCQRARAAAGRSGLVKYEERFMALDAEWQAFYQQNGYYKTKWQWKAWCASVDSADQAGEANALIVRKGQVCLQLSHKATTYYERRRRTSRRPGCSKPLFVPNVF